MDSTQYMPMTMTTTTIMMMTMTTVKIMMTMMTMMTMTTMMMTMMTMKLGWEWPQVRRAKRHETSIWPKTPILLLTLSSAWWGWGWWWWWGLWRGWWALSGWSGWWGWWSGWWWWQRSHKSQWGGPAKYNANCQHQFQITWHQKNAKCYDAKKVKDVMPNIISNV